MSEQMIISGCLCIIFLCLGFWMGRVSSNQGIPGMKIPFKKPPSFDEYKDDPYERAMQDKPVERIETIG